MLRLLTRDSLQIHQEGAVRWSAFWAQKNGDFLQEKVAASLVIVFSETMMVLMARGIAPQH